MSHAALPHVTAETNPRYFLLRRLHSLTGIVFGLYVCVHLLVNATLIQGPGVVANSSIFQLQVDKIHSLPFLLFVEIGAIFAPLLYHTVYGIYVLINGKPNLGSYNYVKNWFYVLQRISAVALVLFIIFHVGAMYGWFGENLRFVAEKDAFGSTVRHLQSSWFLSLVVYPLGVIAGTFHLANGFWTGAIAWGLTVSKQAQMRWGIVCIFIFLFTTACGFAAIAATFMYKTHALPTV